MIDKIKALCKKYREVLMYLVFGVMTTFVGWGVYYAVLLGGRAIFDIPAGETTSARYFALYTAAQIIQWVCAVLFAFFTNRAWVFTEADKSTSLWKQLVPFAGGRVVTLPTGKASRAEDGRALQGVQRQNGEGHRRDLSRQDLCLGSGSSLALRGGATHQRLPRRHGARAHQLHPDGQQAHRAR